MSPTSPAPTKLAALRTELAGMNIQLMELIRQRRDHVALIQTEKGGLGMTTFDPERERSLFGSLHESLAAMSEGEVLAFSLLMESHAGPAYPAWSEGAHLAELGQKSFQRVNPLLVQLLWPEKFATLRLHTDYSFLRDS